MSLIIKCSQSSKGKERNEIFKKKYVPRQFAAQVDDILVLVEFA
jgi:hypothetical protein